MTEEQITQLKKFNYVRAAQKKTDYWLDFAKNVVEEYKAKYGFEFNLIVHSKIESEDEFYVIPFEKVAHAFKDEYLAKDEKRRGNKRWMANIKNHFLKVTNCPGVIDLNHCYFIEYLRVLFLNRTDADFSADDRTQETKVRAKQPKFRKDVLDNFSAKCCISGIAEPELLVASHIVPWPHNKSTRLDPSNGLALFVVYDKLFDKGYFTINDDYTIHVIEKREGLSLKLRELLENIHGTRIDMPISKLKLEYLKYHREKIFMERSIGN